MATKIELKSVLNDLSQLTHKKREDLKLTTIDEVVAPHFRDTEWPRVALESIIVASMCERGMKDGKLPIALLRNPQGAIDARSLVSGITLNTPPYSSIMADYLTQFSDVSQVPHVARMYVDGNRFSFDAITISPAQFES